MTHDEERRHAERQHAGYMSELPRFAANPEMDFFLMLALERKEKEQREAAEKSTEQRA